jgi:uncharacterized cupin superfamily protein
MTRPNAFDADCSGGFDDSDPEGYRCAEGPFGKVAGGKQLAVRLFELPQGQTLCPYHYEYVEEWMLVMTGDVQVRTPAGVEAGRPGDVFCFPIGSEGAHCVWNDERQPARIVMFSSAQEPAVAVYPDSDKVGVWTGDEHDHWMFRAAESHLEYFDGEPLPPKH